MILPTLRGYYMKSWLRTLSDAGWVLLVVALGAVAYLLVTGYGEGAR